ncbi:hypothetical protein H311_05139 [Anncaliia algerae PRA109]|uniref:H/ACA ribonucleoprotein complex subunit NOP10 n=1 Tax=Anncaliia algerae PRA339 TaxID=1288291 RepID=A0A059F0A3_9MICR|nr:hypothetical protein H311_05139 [Anncaliia algerae PRA109]KCZ80728.1 hypothetical protein H312_01855 [Anncaliia algerae PRA339]
MYFYKDINNKKTYTLSKQLEDKFIESAHPARFSPEDTDSEPRILMKRRFKISPFDK